MNKHIKNYDDFLNEEFAAPAASLFNTPGEGNISANNINTAAGVDGTPEQDRAAKHVRMHEHELKSGLERFRPNGNYQNRAWLVGNYEMYQAQGQSITNFSIGENVRCINPAEESYGKTGKIVAFEDNTIRWEVANSETGVGQTAKQYRCHAHHLAKMTMPC